MARSAYRVIGLLAGPAVLAVLILLSAAMPARAADPLPLALFGALLVFTTTFGLPAGGGWISLLPMTTVAAYLVIGLIPAGWTVFVATLVHQAIRHIFAENLEESREPGRLGPISVALANAGIHTLSILVAGGAYEFAGGEWPLATTDWLNVPHLFLLGAVYLIAYHSMTALSIGLRDLGLFQRYWRSLPGLLLYEGAPLVFSPLTAVIYTRLGPSELIRFSALLIVATLLVRDLGLARRRLEQRFHELHSLQSVGQALSASLDLETIVWAIHSAVSRLKPAGVFYVALYDAETSELRFPLAVRDGERLHWRARPAASGQTEYLVRTREPLLIPRGAGAALRKLGLEPVEPVPEAWLGVPLLAGGQALGAIIVQSHAEGQHYTETHLELLRTVAAQAAVALENARLYARTDAALARRVRELDSILQTAEEGLLLLDVQYRILAANRSLAGFAGQAVSEFSGDLMAPRGGWHPPLVEVIGYTEAELRADCGALLNGEQAVKKQEIVLPGPPLRHIARTLAPVRDRDAEVIGWLLVFRDLTEERDLARLRDDLTHMLIHDLRAPAAVMKGSLDMMRQLLRDGQPEEMEQLVSTARDGTNRLLRLINELLDISQLESGQLEVQTEAIDSEALLRDVAGRLAPLTGQASIAVEVQAEAGLPLLDVDPELISRVMTNLLDNAIKFTPNGGTIRLWARQANGDAPGGLEIGVTDQGPGISPEAQARLFKKFEHVNTAGRRTGTGLGLAFCKLAVEAHGGRIWVESDKGQGASFILRLPVVA
jgi:signal transduction histidine kinase/GAF domain-containing protein